MAEIDFTKTPIGSVRLDDEHCVLDILKKTVVNLWATIDDLCRLRPTQRRRFHVSIFGSKSIPPESPLYQDARRTACSLAEMGCVVVTGGGPGLMQAANEGASLGAGAESDCSVGLGLPQLAQTANPYTGRVFRHGSFFSRLQHFTLMSDAYIAFPGGIGTLLELSVVWQLLQVHQLYCTPLILVGGMWPGIVEWVRSFMLEGDFPFLDPLDLEIPRCVPDTEGALAIIQDYYHAWKSHNASHPSSCPAPNPV
jgi:uncharacterized protein (TIGR00730 family)